MLVSEAHWLLGYDTMQSVELYSFSDRPVTSLCKVEALKGRMQNVATNPICTTLLASYLRTEYSLQEH